MKWIGQHIWDFISRFRSDVYLEKVASDAVEGSPDTDTTLALKDGKIVRTAGGTGGGSLTLVDNDIGSPSTTYSNTSTITIQGDEVQSFQNGANNVLLNIGAAITTANNFSISTDPVTSLEGSTLYKIGTPHNSTGKNFFAGDFAGQGSKRATNDTSISWTSNLAGNMEDSSKIVVVVEGPIDNTSSGSGNSIATHTHTVTDDGNSTANGITVTVSNYALDGYEPKRKANIAVSIAPATIASAVASAQGISSTHSGSQKFYSVKISHKSNNLSTQYGTFSSAEFFYDGAQVQPVGTNATIALDSNSTKYLSNIKYYSALQWGVDGADIQNIARDTRGNGSDIRVDISPTGITTDADSVQYLGLTGNSNNSTNDNTNTFETEWVLDSDQYTLNSQVQGRLGHIYGGLASPGTATSYASDSARMWNTYNGNSSALTENFREEEYRLPEHTESTWNTNSVSQALATWQGYSVSGAMGNSSVTINNAHNTTKDLVLQVQSSSGTFKLMHPYNFDQLTVAANPAQDKYSGTAISQASSVKYYRWFRFSSAVTSFDCDITGMTRSSYDSHENLGRINIKFSRPGVDNTWVPLDPDQGFQSGSPNDSCWDASNSYSSGTPGYNSDTNVFKCVFGTASILFVMEMTMNGYMSSNITQIQLST